MTSAEFHAVASVREWPERPRFLRLFRRFAEVVCAADAFLIVTAGVVSGYAYHRLILGSPGDGEIFFGVGTFFAIYYSIVMAARDNFRSIAVANYTAQFREISLVWMSGFFILMMAMFTLKTSSELSRGATAVFLVTGLGGLLLWRRFVALGLRAAIARGEFVQRNIILVGETEQLAGAKVVDELRRGGSRSVKVFAANATDLGAQRIHPVLRQLVRDIVEASRNFEVDEIILALDWHHGQRIEELVHELRIVPLPVRLLPDQNALRFLGTGGDHSLGSRAVELQRAPLSDIEQALKRLIDLTCASTALLLFAPLLLFTSLLIKLDSRGPILFTQTRNGFSGRPFRIFKFRSMTVTEDGPVIRQATRNDKRVTRVGRLLRMTSIDELPQLLNVLLGDMSLVGPRPHAFAHDTEFEKLIASYAFRHHVKPGITGWAQVNGQRGETPTVDLMERRVELDLWYINNWNLWLDLKILVRTLIIMGHQPSAY
jgi:undecaprenyl-phosphate galactose phosphotransferase/putative colanic acid biosynthesis UDP-glucose lipid carrier transferase